MIDTASMKWNKSSPKTDGWYFCSSGGFHNWASWRYWSDGKWSKCCSIAECDRFAKERSLVKTEDKFFWSDYLHPKALGDRSKMFNVGAPMYATKFR